MLNKPPHKPINAPCGVHRPCSHPALPPNNYLVQFIHTQHKSIGRMASLLQHSGRTVCMGVASRSLTIGPPSADPPLRFWLVRCVWGARAWRCPLRVCGIFTGNSRSVCLQRLWCRVWIFSWETCERNAGTDSRSDGAVFVIVVLWCGRQICAYMYNMSCSEVMYQAYYPYLYQRAGGAPPVSAHPVPRAGPFSSPFGAAHQYDRVGETNYLYVKVAKLSNVIA